MATMYPPNFPFGDDPKRWAEKQAYEAFQKLPNPWAIHYSIGWQSLRNGRQGDGEADFVLVHPLLGIFVAEVKGGSTIELVNGEWFSVSAGERHDIRDPFSQCTDSKYALRSYLSERVTGFRDDAAMGHFVVFPSHHQEEDLGPNAPREIICDKDDLDEIGATMNRITRHWNLPGQFSDRQMQEIRQCLARTTKISRLLRDRVEEVNLAIDELTVGQLNAMSMLRHQRKQLIIGGAGTGKTVLAMNRARQLADDGFRTLLVCYNAPLGRRLDDEFSDEELVTAGHFHGICEAFRQRAGLQQSQPTDEIWWEEDLPRMLPEAAELLGIQFDAIVVDEGQDICAEWWLYLNLLFPDPDDGVLSVFADSNQDLYRRGWLPPFSNAPFPLDQNCRNTVEIAARVSAAASVETKTLGIHGVDPVFKDAETDQQIRKALASSLDRLINVGTLDPSQVTVLSNWTGDVRDLDDVTLKGVALRASPNDGVFVETIGRFKGLESDAIVILLHDEEPTQLRRHAYVGLSRARAVLHVIGSGSVRGTLNWNNIDEE